MSVSTQTFLSGKLGTVAFGALVMDVTGWTFTSECKIEDTTNTGDLHSDGLVYESHVITTMSGKGTAKMDWDALKKPCNQTPKIAAGTQCALTLNISAGTYVYCPIVTITNMPIVSEVKGKISYSIDFICQGPFTMPV